MLIDRSGRVWAARRDGLMVQEAVALREAGKSPVALTGEPLAVESYARLANGVAIIPVYGLLLRTFSPWFWSYEEIARDIALAQADPRVRSIVLDIDSPGGMAAGCGDLTAMIRASGPKAISAFVGGTAASGAYWIASATDEVVCGSAAILGSIGVVIEWLDFEPIYIAMGARRIEVVAGDSPNKRLDPESPEGQAEMQALVDATCAEFVDGVAAGRGVTPETVLAEFGQGLVFDGDEAIRRGMADRRGTLMQLVADMAGRDPISNADPAPAAEESPMDWASLTTAALREHRPDIAAECEAAATKATDTRLAEAVTAERNRILAIDEIAGSAPAKLVREAKADGKSTAAELALAILKADAAEGGKHLKALAEEDVDLPAGAPPQSTTTGGTPAEKAEAAWTRDADLRAEFGGNKEAYLAFAKAEAEGRARVLTRN